MVHRPDPPAHDPLRAGTNRQDSPREALRGLKGRLDRAHLPDLARTTARVEWDRLAAGEGPLAPRLARLEWLLELPWNARVPIGREPDPARVARQLDREVFGLDEAKQRLLEALAVERLTGRPGGVLGFCGPPGTGKTALARALARALDRPFVWIPVGAITEEVELTGRPLPHPEAMPGAVLESLRRAGPGPTVLVLDELDKLQLGAEGDSLASLLPLFDRESRPEFLDRYLGIPFDLSSHLVIAMAQDPEELTDALADRLDRIDFHGYSEREKVRLARRHLVPAARSASGLKATQITVTDGALTGLIQSYTEEAGVRQLERHLFALARKAAARSVRGESGLRVRRGDLLEHFGSPTRDEELRRRRPSQGHVLGLAWTSAGGSLLPIEALATRGSGRTVMTGQVGEVMRESFQTACTYVRTRLHSLGLPRDAFEQLDLHLHLPSGAIPKDGPSAGLAIAVAVYSLAANRRIRHDVALTGELSLYGAVLAVGGLREKLLAAHRAGLRTVVVPAGNADDLRRLPADLKESLEIYLVAHVEQALEICLCDAPTSRPVPHRRPSRGLDLPAVARGRRRRSGETDPGS